MEDIFKDVLDDSQRLTDHPAQAPPQSVGTTLPPVSVPPPRSPHLPQLPPGLHDQPPHPGQQMPHQQMPGGK